MTSFNCGNVYHRREDACQGLKTARKQLDYAQHTIARAIRDMDKGDEKS